MRYFASNIAGMIGTLGDAVGAGIAGLTTDPGGVGGVNPAGVGSCNPGKRTSFEAIGTGTPVVGITGTWLALNCVGTLFD